MYNFELADFDLKGGQAPDVASVKCVDRKYVEVTYMNGRKVRYLYNPIISEKGTARREREGYFNPKLGVYVH